MGGPEAQTSVVRLATRLAFAARDLLAAEDESASSSVLAMRRDLLRFAAGELLDSLREPLPELPEPLAGQMTVDDVIGH